MCPSRIAKYWSLASFFPTPRPVGTPIAGPIAMDLTNAGFSGQKVVSSRLGVPARNSGAQYRPAGAEPAGVERPPSANSRGGGTSLRGLRIVVVEDDDDSRELLSAILNEAGARVESVASAAEGIAAVRRVRPQILVSDIAMPDEDGYSLLRKVRALGAAEGGAVPAIALSAFTQPEDCAKALAAGFTLHVGKPIVPQDFVEIVRDLSALWRRAKGEGTPDLSS